MNKSVKPALSVLVIALFFGFWELAGRFDESRLLPPFSRAAGNIFVMFQNRNLAGHIAVSLGRAAAGLALGVVFGVPLGLLLGAAGERLGILLGAFWRLLAQVNPFLLYHVLISFLGIGEAAKVSILAWGCLWPVTFNTAGGVENTDRILLKAGRAFGGGKLSLFFTVVLPASAPRICAGARIASTYALLMLTASEILGARSGLGWLVLIDQAYFRVVNIFSVALLTALLGVLMDLCLAFIQKKIVPYEMEAYANSAEN